MTPMRCRIDRNPGQRFRTHTPGPEATHTCRKQMECGQDTYTVALMPRSSLRAATPQCQPSATALAVQDEELQAALNVVLEENMYLGQVLFYTLDRLFLQYGHAISNAAIVCMPASSVVDPEVRPPTGRWVPINACF